MSPPESGSAGLRARFCPGFVLKQKFSKPQTETSRKGRGDKERKRRRKSRGGGGGAFGSAQEEAHTSEGNQEDQTGRGLGTLGSQGNAAALRAAEEEKEMMSYQDDVIILQRCRLIGR